MIGLCQEGKSSPDALREERGCEFLFAAGLETYQRGHREVCLLAPSRVNGKTRQETRLKSFTSGQKLGGCAHLVIEHEEMGLPTVHGHQVGHQFPGDRQGRAIHIPFLPLFVVKLCQRRVVARGHLRRLD